MKHLLFIFIFISSLVTAQIPELALSQKGSGEPNNCIISGSTTIEAGSQYSYSIPNGLAQCLNCYDWDIVASSEPSGGGPASAVGSDTGRTFTLQANNPGTFILRVTYFNETGCHDCSISITVEPDCSGIEDDVDGTVVCSFGKSGIIQVDENIELGTINRIDWVYDQSLNGIYYTGLIFDDSNDYQVTSLDPSNHFLEAFTFTGPCRGGNYEEIFFRRVIKTPGCPVQYDVVRLFSENNSPFVSVTPNPAISKVEVSLLNLAGKTVSLKLYSMNGELLSTQTVIVNNENLSKQLNIPKTSGKMILLKVFENNKIIETKKIALK